MKPLRLLFLFCVMTAITGSTQADAAGIFSKFRGKSARRAVTTDGYSLSPTRGYSTRNLNQGRSRLPSGRSYFQGRYYGNYNNRFYGPQYGYF